MDHSANSINLPIINQSPSFDAASWNSSTNIVLSPILSHIYQHENELKQYFIKYKACIVHFGECSSLKKRSYLSQWGFNIPGYTVKMKNRKFMSFKKSGVIILAYKNEYEKYISELPNESNFILWFKISKELTACDEDIIHGIVYIPPENSKYASIDALSEIENEYQNFRTKNKYFCLHGDFNSRMSEEPDLIDFDRELDNNENVEHLFINTSNCICFFRYSPKTG